MIKRFATKLIRETEDKPGTGAAVAELMRTVNTAEERIYRNASSMRHNLTNIEVGISGNRICEVNLGDLASGIHAAQEVRNAALSTLVALGVEL